MKGKDKNKSSTDISNIAHLVDLTPALNCPKYTSIVQKRNENICVEDITTLQYELEYLLSCATKKSEKLKKKLDILDDTREETEKKCQGNSMESKERRLSTDEKSNKKFKDSSGKAQNATTSGRTKSKNLQPTKPQNFEISDPSIDLPKAAKNDSNRFWSFFDPYCAKITQEDIKAIEEWTKSHENDVKYQEVPPLGEHFTLKWIQEDIQDEIKEGSKSMGNPRGFVDPVVYDMGREKIFNRIENECVVNSSESERTPLTDRLINCLVEENLMISLDDEMADITEDDYAAVKPLPKMVQSVNSNTLEKRLRKELSELGALEAEVEEECCEDELLLELKRLQESLIPVCDYNIMKKKKLLVLAKEEIAKQEIQKRLQEADAKVMEAYRTIAAVKQKGKKLNKKEQEQACKVLKDREKLIKELDNMK